MEILKNNFKNDSWFSIIYKFAIWIFFVKDFTNTIDDSEIEKIAEVDENDLIKSI